MARSSPLTLSRIGRGVERRARAWRERGDEVSCPICGCHYARFKDDWNRPNALCWRCGSHERHRAQWLFLQRRIELLLNATALLHFAPELALRRHLQRIPGVRYVTADLYQPGVDLQLDLRDLDLPDGSFDAVICSHVLEHVSDDARAMSELHRITAPGGWCLVMVPLDLTRAHTYEDPAIVSPEDRTRAFWQHDHVRLYGLDIGDRLAAAGFQVDRIRPAEQFGADAMARHRIVESDEIWLCRTAG